VSGSAEIRLYRTRCPKAQRVSIGADQLPLVAASTNGYGRTAIGADEPSPLYAVAPRPPHDLQMPTQLMMIGLWLRHLLTEPR
jgi:hypothetical protein